MNTQQAIPQIPAMQLAKVGEKRRKKGGALPWFGGSGTAVRSGGGIFGTVSGIASQSALKIGITLLVGALGVGAYNVGKSLRPDENKYERKPAIFAPKNEKASYGDASSLPGGSAPVQNSVGMVSGSLDGLTPAERAARAAKAEAEAKAAAEAQAKADAEAKAKEAANVSGAVTPDPGALAAAASVAKEKEREGAFSRKFGELAKGSGGLAGGSGLSGGIGQGFAPLAKNNANSGVLSTLGSNRAGVGSSASHIMASRNPGRSLAQRQLNRAAQMVGQTRAGANEARSTAASIPFDTGSGSGQTLSGAGGSTGGASPATGAADANPTTGGGGTPVGIGGGSSAGADDCGNLASKYGWQGNFVNSADGGCVLSQSNVAGTGANDPTNMYFKILEVLSLLAMLISAFLFIVGAWKGINHAVVQALAMALIAIGAFQCILGLMLVGMGRTIEGGIFTGIGALTGIAGYLAMTDPFVGGAGAEAAIQTTTGLVLALSALAEAGGTVAGAME